MGINSLCIVLAKEVITHLSLGKMNWWPPQNIQTWVLPQDTPGEEALRNGVCLRATQFQFPALTLGNFFFFFLAYLKPRKGKRFLEQLEVTDSWWSRSHYGGHRSHYQGRR